LTHGLTNLSDILRNDKSFRNGSISIGFGWGRVQSQWEYMPRGPCHGPEARKGQRKVVMVDVRKLNKKQMFDAKRNTLEMGSCAMDLDGVGCKINGKTCPLVLVMVPRPEKVE
jgi:hypothetical protein